MEVNRILAERNLALLGDAAALMRLRRLAQPRINLRACDLERAPVVACS